MLRENGNTKIAFSTLKSYCDYQLVMVDEEVLCKLCEIVHRQGVTIKMLSNDDNHVDGGQGDGDNKEEKEDKLGNATDCLLLVLLTSLPGSQCTVTDRSL